MTSDILRLFLNNIKLLLDDNKEYNSIEIINIIDTIEKQLEPHYNVIFKFLLENIGTKKKVLIHIVTSINNICKKHNIEELKIEKNDFKKNIDNFSKFYKSSNKINGHTYLSFVMLNKWMENYKSWK